jgi:hypothetical protein
MARRGRKGFHHIGGRKGRKRHRGHGLIPGIDDDAPDDEPETDDVDVRAEVEAARADGMAMERLTAMIELCVDVPTKVLVELGEGWVERVLAEQRVMEASGNSNGDTSDKHNTNARSN